MKQTQSGNYSSDVYHFISRLVTDNVRVEVERAMREYVDQLLQFPEIKRFFSVDELSSLIQFDDFSVIPENIDRELCHARVSTGERCSRKCKRGDYCGAHNKSNSPDRIDVPKIDLETERPSRKITKGAPSNLEKDYIQVEHVEIHGVKCYMDDATGVLFDEHATIIGHIHGDSLTWFD